MVRGFKLVSRFQGQEEALLPRRSTLHAAGYDFFAAEKTAVPPLQEDLTPILVATGVKAYMPDDEYLMLVNRSSSPRKHHLILPNGVGIIDADYYNNENNEGEIYLQLINYGPKEVVVEKGSRICQGLFMKYHLADNEISPQNARQGGFGSSGH